MPHSKTAKKRMRQDAKRTVLNRQVQSRMRTAVKKALAAAGDPEKARPLIDNAYKCIDKAAKKNIIHPNNAARKKSKLAKTLQKKTD